MPRSRREFTRRDEVRERLYGGSDYESVFGPCLSVAPGGSDRDRDGYDDDADGCPDEPEDFDAFEDDDGCPDRDNDGDGVLDAVTYDEETMEWSNEDARALPNGDRRDCRNEPEDVDGVEDDGCPDVDEADEPAPSADPPGPKNPVTRARARVLESLARARALPPDVLARLRRRAGS